jgi:hypothetical protein
MLVTMPAKPIPADIDWSIDVPAQMNRSEFTGRRRTVLLSAAPRWYARVTLPPIRGEAAVLAWRAFVVDLEGIANKFRLVACERDQVEANIAVTVVGAGQGGRQLLTTGWPPSSVPLRRGQFFTSGEQLLMLMADVEADASGAALLRFKSHLRFSPANGAQLEVRRPYAVMAMSDPRNGWKVGIGQNYGVSFDCEEDF